MRCKKFLALSLALSLTIAGSALPQGLLSTGGMTAWADETGITDALETDSGEPAADVLETDSRKPAAGYQIETKAFRTMSQPMTIASNSCGTNLTWKLSNGTLTISGKGEMQEFEAKEFPWYDSRDSITAIVVESGVTSISQNAFYDMQNLTRVSLPDTLVTVGSGVFFECSSLKEISLPVSVKRISGGLFAGCTSLTKVSMPGAEAIEDYAFQDTALTTITIGKKITEISYLAFFSSNITSYQVEAGNSVYSASAGVLYTDDGETLFSYPAAKPDTQFTIPAAVKTVGSGAFIKNKYLVQITIPNGVTSLGTSTFQECDALKSIVIPDSVTSADYFTFYACPALESVTFGKGLAATSYEMFEKCYSLEKIDFGGALKSIDARTFAYCSALQSVTLPSNITEIGNGSFAECWSLEKVTTYALKEIPYQAFLNDSSLETLVLNEGITVINRCAFLGCTNLLSVTLPASVNFVVSTAFEMSTKLVPKNTELGAYGANGLRKLEFLTVSGEYRYADAFDVLKILNQERKEAGMAGLVMNESLMQTAMQRAAEISILFAHTRPDGSSCFDANELMYAENVAFGYTTPDDVMVGWMNSEGHRANILTEGFTTVGIGCFEMNGSLYWVQCFGAGEDQADCKCPADKAVAQKVQIATETFEEAPTTTGIIWGETETYTYTSQLFLSAEEIKKGQTATAEYRLNNPGNNVGVKIKNEELIWSSSNTAVATVQNGTITAVGEGGSAVITAKMKNGSYAASAKISVAGPEASYTITFDSAGGSEVQKQTVKKGQKVTQPAAPTKKGYTFAGWYNGSTKYDFSKAVTGNLTLTAKWTYQCSTPVISKAENTNGGVKLTWNKVTGAAKYRVFYKKNGKWTKIADTTGTSYTWAGAASGTSYIFTVRCVSNDGSYYTSNYNTAGKSIRYIAAPVISKAENVNGGVKLTWNKVTGAAKYRVFYKKNGKWAKIADTTGTSYTWKGAASGTKYTFTVRCVSSDGKNFTSGYNASGKSVRYLAQPEIKKFEANNSGLKITWGKVTGAAKYRVYYKTAKGWKQLRETSGTSCTINATLGKSYTYTVRAFNGSDSSTYNKTGKAFKRVATPKLSGAINVKGGVKISWGRVSGAQKYRVFYKKNGKWTKLTDTTSTSYTWKKAKKGTTYTFTVRCINSKASAYTSGYNTAGKKVKYNGK